MKGFVYIMSNESMPGIFKIGCTSRRPNERANDLYTTGVPRPFVIEYCIYIDDYQLIERLIHIRLQKYNYNKEFFQCDLVRCILELKNVAIERSSYKEKYINQHLRSKVEGWEYQYLREKQLESRRIKMEQEAHEAKKLKIKRDAEIRQKEIEERNKKGCIFVVASIIIGLVLMGITGNVWILVICCAIGLMLSTEIF